MLAMHVICLLDSSEFRLRMGQAAPRNVAERHVISMAAARIAEIIDRTIVEAETQSRWPYPPSA
jgi:hypothetical protein